jgi:F-type H+-transporting ATPase subunit alpha
MLFAGTNGFSDNVPLDRMVEWETSLLRYMETSHPDIGKDIADRRLITDETETKLRKSLETFMTTWQ